MWRIIHQVYGRRQRRIRGGGLTDTRKRLASILRNSPWDYDIVGGHVRFGIGDNCKRRPFSYFTLLRDPTDIVLSRYYRRNNPCQPKVLANKFRERGLDPHKAEEVLNAQGRPGAPIDAIRTAGSNPLTRVISGKPRSAHEGNEPTTKAHLNQAKENLASSFLAFGFVERFTETVSFLAAQLGWPQTPIPEPRNQGTNRPTQYDPAVYDAGREINALDYELYDFAERLFEERQRSSPNHS